LPPPLLEVVDEAEVVELVEVEVPLEVVVELDVDEHEHADSPSMTHCASQVLAQQYESIAQTVVTQGSHPEVSFAPAAHGEWAQLPPEEVVDELEVVEPVLEPPQLPGGGWQVFDIVLHHQPP
jgi:hypothetical protein